MLLACYSHKHISYRIRTIIRKAIMISSINKQLVMDSLLMAVNKRKPAKNLLLHSDQGSQYTSQGYQYLLSIKNIDEL
ncbi:DDE-type integrase/transposase/recombinase [Wolbachia endosymbiont (group A) of Nomada hirtipes]|uniref:DDE-type integrase/transposase/recombinase n=1 Tax=Wolbachia endosymbiont (group A) of Nomada hirtipes TaxID=3066208 RepID=UPI0030D5C7A2